MGRSETSAGVDTLGAPAAFAVVFEFTLRVYHVLCLMPILTLSSFLTFPYFLKSHNMV